MYVCFHLHGIGGAASTLVGATLDTTYVFSTHIVLVNSAQHSS